MKFFAIFTAFVFLSLSANAQMGEWFKEQDFSARLLAGSSAEAALEIKLADGWHTYWRIPGDSGLPPMFSWAESKNIESVEISWPAPVRKKEYEFYTFGFDERLLLPLKLIKKQSDEDAVLDLKAQIMICKDICVPQKFDLTLNVKASDQEDRSEENAIIAAAKKALPSENPSDGLNIESMVAAKNTLVLSVSSENGFENMDVFPVIEEDFLGLTTPPVIEVSKEDEKKALIKIAAPSDIENLAAALQEKTLSVTLVKDDKAVMSSVQY